MQITFESSGKLKVQNDMTSSKVRRFVYLSESFIKKRFVL